MQCRLILVWMVAISLTMAQQSNAKPFTISGPPVAESCCFAIMTAKNLVPEGIKMEFIPWHSPDQARALVASGRVDAMITSSSGAAVFNQKGIKTKIAGLFNPPVWVVSAKSMALPGPLQGTLLFPFGHKEMPELIFDIVYGHPPELDGRHTGGSMEAVNLLLAGKADHALLAEPAASIAVVRSAKGPVPLVKHRDISKDWSTKFDGRPLFVSAFAVFGEALDRKEDVQAAIKGYTVARLWMINHPEEALALIRKIMPVMAPQVGEALPLSPGVTMETNENAFSSAFFFMNRIYQTSPKSMGGKAPEMSLFMKLY